jgi:hypothetical protein
MKLNLELLKKIQDQVRNENYSENQEEGWNNLTVMGKNHYWPEVCRRYSEQIIKCTECYGTGEHEINVDGMDAPSADGCIFCEGEGYLKD